MSKTNRLLAITNSILALILVLGLAQFAPSAASADSSTITACANKKTGALRLAYKSCTKKENPISWGSIGSQGATGATGPQGATGQAGQDKTGYSVLRDANGDVLDQVVSIDIWNGTFYRKVGNYIWQFSMLNGQPFGGADDEVMLFKNNTCTGEFMLGTYLNQATPTTFYSTSKTYAVNKPGLVVGYFVLSSATPITTAAFTHQIDWQGNCVAYAPTLPNYGFQATEITSLPSIPAPIVVSVN